MKLLIGLGNPGDKYVGTRHNLGFNVVDELAKKMDIGQWTMDNKFKSEIIQTPEIILVKPQTYMNKSGLAVKLLTTYYKLPATNVIVVYDELDLPLGKIKIRLGGAAAGHHGVESIIEALDTDKFHRVRLGIGNLRTQSGERKGQTVSAEKFVLSAFLHSEKPQVKHMIKQAIRSLTEKFFPFRLN